MKRLLAIVALCAVVFLAGCGQQEPQISGSVATVVKEAQEIPADSKDFLVEVTGTIDEMDEGSLVVGTKGLIMSSDKKSVYLDLRDNALTKEDYKKVKDKRFTVTGSLDPSNIKEDFIYLTNVEFK